MSAMLSMSVLLGSCLQLLDERADDRRRVVRAGGCLRGELRRARAEVGIVEALHRPVVQRAVRDAGLVAGCDREAVVLRGDEHLARPVVEHGMVCTAMPERQLERLLAVCHREQLVAETD